MLSSLRVRLATPDDRDTVRKVCLSAVGGDDYVLYDLDAWFKTGEISLAEGDAGESLGVMRTIDLPDGAAWLASIRTTKEAQGRGVATEMTKAALHRGKGRGLTHGRMLISARNTASLRVAAKCGLEEVFRAAVLERGEEGGVEEDLTRKARSAEAGEMAGSSTRVARSPGTPEALAAFAKPLGRRELDEGPVVIGLRGYVGLFFTFVSAEREVIEHCAPRTMPILVDGERFIFTANRTEPWHGLQPVTSGPGVGRAAVRALEIAGIGEGVVFLPLDESFHRPYLDEGFFYSKWAREAVILEVAL